ncbi:FkbM family methyltransferase [Alloacidobacterium dinghuense]|uniref:FkbM family methyltransferase n=1 Tax=Alloacidobacterium dinghuense TaxID=2763107 RepID=A0A7G8BKJ9_9BACT|nr:FkbM family methyltransferase [Alloacidobacterium dinghuense]QNI33069.1 FkbM family methyltransferase [Alloacidobacterium dinghuense]
MAIKEMIPDKLLMPLVVWKALMRREPELKLARFICSRSELSVDVGANRGIYAYLFAKYSDSVLAIEPHPAMAERLKRSLPAKVKILNIAASDQNGRCEFHIPLQSGRDVDSRCSLEVDVNREFATRTISVERRRLDKLAIDRSKVGALKVDVEGHEMSALRGLEGIVEASKPTVVVESEARHHAGSPHDVFEFFWAFGYRGYFIHRNHLRRIEEFSVEEFQVCDELLPVDGGKSPDYINNFLFIHSARSSVLERVKGVFPLANESATHRSESAAVKGERA